MPDPEEIRPLVLVVDDEESERAALSAILGGAGFAVRVSSSGATGLDGFLEGGVKVVVTDIAMADWDGIELMRMIRSVNPDLPVVAVSGKGPDHLAAARVMGAVTVLEKPIRGDELIEAVRGALEK